jgi:glycosyltransferase involved in cell wall biosynthesis
MTKKKGNKNADKYPVVSICTPTYNRRPFIPYMIKCFEHQTYPKDKIEWIIIDDGSDPIGDLVKHIPQVKYFYYAEKMPLGKKRNKMHSECTGDIIVYMDDDDYYPPERISHAVEMLLQNPKVLVAGSSEMHIYSDNKKKLFQCGPYRTNHATAATFAFKRQLLSQTRYDEHALFAEEKQFLKDYSIPMVQLDTLKTILVCSHKHNSLNKEKLLENPAQSKIIDSKFSIDDFIKEPELKQFYIYDMNNILESYELGKVEYKANLLEQINKKEVERNKMVQQQREFAETQNKIIQNLQLTQSMESLKLNYEKQLEAKNTLISELLKRVKELTSELENLKNNNYEII